MLYSIVTIITSIQAPIKGNLIGGPRSSLQMNQEGKAGAFRAFGIPRRGILHSRARLRSGEEGLLEAALGAVRAWLRPFGGGSNGERAGGRRRRSDEPPVPQAIPPRHRARFASRASSGHQLPFFLRAATGLHLLIGHWNGIWKNFTRKVATATRCGNQTKILIPTLLLSGKASSEVSPPDAIPGIKKISAGKC